MRANKLGKIFGVASLSLVLMLSAGTDTFAQGKGKGGGGGHGGGNGNGNGGGQHQDRGGGGGGNPGRGNGNGGGGWKHQGGGPPQVQAQPQYRPQPQQRQIWQQAPQQVFPTRVNGNGRGNGNGKNKREERRVYNAPQMDYRRQERRVYNAPQIQQQWAGGRIPPGQIRKQEVHARNDERKAIKEQEKAYRRYERENRNAYVPQPVYRSYDRNYDADQYQYRTRQPRTYDRSYDRYQYQGPVAPQYNPGYFGYDPYQYQSRSPAYNSGYYDQNYYGDEYGYEDGSSWKQQLLRTLISSVLGGYLNRDGGDYAYNGYDDGGYDSYYANGPVRYAYTQPLYSRVGYSPSYAGYGQSYLPYSSYGQDYGYDYDAYDQGSGGLLGSLPIGGFFSGSRGGFLSQILGQVVAQGYLQGLLEGQAAKEYGYADENYYDPYVSEDGIYDPFSTSIGENRRLMSEGYDLGYQDALAGREQFDPEDVGNIDLVSLLLGNVFRLG